MRRSSFMLLIILASSGAYAQICDSTLKYKPLFGFNIGLNQSAIFNSNAVDEIQIMNAPGFRLGIFTEFPISKRWAASPKTELSFNYGKVNIDGTNYRVDPYNLDFILHFKHKFNYSHGKVQPYMNIGPNIRTPLNSKFEGTYLDTKTSIAADFGFGLEIDANYFLIAPELRFSAGLTDIRRNPSGNILRGSNAVLSLNFIGK